MAKNDTKRSLNFVEEIIEEDNRTGKWGGRVHTRFPPEPNGCMHIGHAKGICLSFGLALEYGGKYNLRFDDTNPVKEEEEYVEAITEDIRWLGFDLEGRILFGSDYFQQMYEWAVQLIRDGKAYVCDLTPEQTRILDTWGQSQCGRATATGVGWAAAAAYIERATGQPADWERMVR